MCGGGRGGGLGDIQVWGNAFEFSKIYIFFCGIKTLKSPNHQSALMSLLHEEGICVAS